MTNTMVASAMPVRGLLNGKYCISLVYYCLGHKDTPFFSKIDKYHTQLKIYFSNRTFPRQFINRIQHTDLGIISLRLNTPLRSLAKTPLLF